VSVLLDGVEFELEVAERIGMIIVEKEMKKVSFNCKAFQIYIPLTNDWPCFLE
jgi:hypothetical protein